MLGTKINLSCFHRILITTKEALYSTLNILRVRDYVVICQLAALMKMFSIFFSPLLVKKKTDIKGVFLIHV